MKRWSKWTAAAVLCLCLAGCGGAIPDGTYTAEMKNASHEYRDYLTVTYEGGKIINADFDSKHETTGKLKSETTPEEYPMPFHPSEWMPMLEENIKKAGTSAKMDAVAGATWGSENAKALLKAIEDDKGRAGGTIVVDNEA